MRTGSLTPPYFHDVYRDAAALSKETASEVWQDVFALGIRGDLLPKHSILSAFIAVPFYALFGDAGFWIMQQLCFLCVVFATYLLVERITGVFLPWTTLISVSLLTPTIFYSYSFSYDLHSCGLIMGGLYLMRFRPMIGGALMASCIFIRPSEILLGVPVAISAASLGGRSRLFRGLLGIGLVLVSFFALNTYFWGDPRLTAYSRLPGFINGDAFLSPHPMGFDVKVLLNDWGEKLFSEQGLLPFTLSTVALPAVVVATIRSGSALTRICLAVSIAYTMFIFSYPMWNLTHYGNRYLLSAFCLYLLCFIPFAGRLEQRYLSDSNR